MLKYCLKILTLNHQMARNTPSPWDPEDLILFLKNNCSILKGSKHGLEKECLRVTPSGNLATTCHPHFLGSKLTHPHISTDFSEAQLELITSAFSSEKRACGQLEQIHRYIHQNLSQEYIWPSSMPCRLSEEKSIVIADFGSSHVGQEKTIYRRGLAHRYGRKLQTISGGHYNFSFSKTFWSSLQKKFSPSCEQQDFINTSYLCLIRNFFRTAWIHTYLFGASPIADPSFFESASKASHPQHPYATSLRSSNYGYTSKVQAQHFISYNSFESYLNDLNYALNFSHPEYEKIGLYKGGEEIQLNTHLLQIINENYTRIRPKSNKRKNLSPLENLRKKGIDYVETRLIDLDPFSPIGIQVEQLYFIHTLLLHSLATPSPFLHAEEARKITKNQNLIALQGRDPNLKVIQDQRQVPFRESALNLLNSMAPFAAILDQAFSTKRYSLSLEEQVQKVLYPSLTPSSKIIDSLKKKDFITWNLCLSQGQRKSMKSLPLSFLSRNKWKKLSEDSLLSQKKLEMQDSLSLRGYQDMEISTQLLIQAAKKESIDVEIIDRRANFICLKKGNRQEYVKEATKTSKDSYISFLMMENKVVSKHLLFEKDIVVPKGRHYASLEKALEDYPKFSSQHTIVKPTNTNFGIGVFNIPPQNPTLYKYALKEAFKQDHTVIVEKFIKGEEFRFLVVDNQVIAIVKRLPANVEGDGKKTVQQLVKEKNHNPESFKAPKYFIQLKKHEKEMLKRLSLTPKSIPQKGQKIFLRSNSNVCTGGDPIDVTDDVCLSYQKIAIQSAQAAQASICGVDMMIQDVHTPANKNNYAVIEINFNPTLAIHHFPYQGRSRPCARAILKMLGLVNEPPLKKPAH